MVVEHGPFLDNLDDDVGVGEEELGGVLGDSGRYNASARRLVVADELDLQVVGGREPVPVMQERVLRLVDAHEGGLEAALEILDGAFEDGADHAILALVFDIELVEDAVGERRASPTSSM